MRLKFNRALLLVGANPYPKVSTTSWRVLLQIKISFKSVQRQLNESLRQQFLQEEATILQNEKPPRRPVASAQLSWLIFVILSHSRPLQIVVPDSLKSVVAVEVVPADVVRRVGGADSQKRHGAQLGLNATDSLLKPDLSKQIQDSINSILGIFKQT